VIQTALRTQAPAHCISRKLSSASEVATRRLPGRMVVKKLKIGGVNADIDIVAYPELKAEALSNVSLAKREQILVHVREFTYAPWK